MRRLRTRILGALGLFALAGLGVLACSDGGEAGPTTESRRQVMLEALLVDVIRPELTQLRASAEAFATSAEAYRDGMEPTSYDLRRLEALRAAWREFRADWRRNEIWMVGPIAEALGPKRLESALDPTALRDARKIFRNVAEIASARDRAADLGAGAKGFAATAELVFEEPGGADLAGRYLLAAVAREQATLVAGMTAPWLEESGALAVALTRPEVGSVFETRKEAVDALVRQAVVLSMRFRDDDLAPLVGGTARGVVQKLPENFDPIDQHRADLLQSYLGLQQFYLGRHGGKNGPGLSSLVKPRSESVDRVARSAFERAVAAMAALPEDVDAAGAEGDGLRTAAYDGATLVKAQLGTSVVALLETSLGFALADGD